MSDTTKNTISISVLITVSVFFVGIVFTLFQIIRSSDVQASVERDSQLSSRIDKIEKMQDDLSALKEGQIQIMTTLGIKKNK